MGGPKSQPPGASPLPPHSLAIMTVPLGAGQVTALLLLLLLSPLSSWFPGRCLYAAAALHDAYNCALPPLEWPQAVKCCHFVAPAGFTHLVCAW